MTPGSVQGRMVEEFVDELCKEHRTHQASVIRNIQHILFAYAQNMEGKTDDRNDAAVNFAKKVRQLDDISIPYV